MSNPLDPHRIVAGSQFGWAPEKLSFDTVHELFWQRVAELGDQPMMRQKDLGIWRAYSWKDVGVLASEIGAGLVSLGFEPGEVVSVLANTSREWVWTDLAVLSVGGICNGIYPTDAASQVHYLCSDSRSAYLFVENDEQLDKYLEVRDSLPDLRQVVVYDMEGLAGLNDPRVISLERLREIGREHLRGPSATDRNAPALAPARRCRDPRLHLGHHRQAQGRHDHPRQPVRGARRTVHQPVSRPARGRRAHRLPAPVPHRRTHDR
jgi:acyl-CoA synthetase (AMP-forming)/AMP-acid ligase II